MDDQLVLIALSDGNTVHLIDVREAEEEDLRDFLLDLFTNHKLIIHNAMFDLPWLFHRSEIAMVETFDTMVMEQMLTAGLDVEVSLAACVKRYFNEDLDKELQTSFGEGELSEEQLTYAALDAYWTYRLSERQFEEIDTNHLRTIMLIERNATPVFAAMKESGLAVDLKAHARIIDDYRDKALEYGERLLEALGPHHAKVELPKLEKMREAYQDWEARHAHALSSFATEWGAHQEAFDGLGGEIAAAAGDPFAAWWLGNKYHDQKLQPKYKEPMGLRRFRAVKEREWKKENPNPGEPPTGIAPLNLNSSQQMVAALNSAGIKISSYGADAIAEALVKSKNQKHIAILKDIQDFKRNETAVKNYSQKFLDRRWSDGKFHPEYRQYGAASGRPSAARINVMQIKRGPLREVIMPDSDRYVFIVCDYSQMELRLLAELTGDPVLIEAFVKGLDIHTETAISVLKAEDPSKEQRNAAKAVSFGIPYGGGPHMLQSKLMEQGQIIPWGEAKEIIDGWQEVHAVAWEGIESWRDHAVEQGWIATFFGRKRWFPKDAPPGNIRREGGNHVIQGTNADITKIAMAQIHRRLLPLGGMVKLNVYDEIVAQVPYELRHEGAEIVRQGMIEAAQLVLKRVPVEIDLTISQSWSEEDAID